MLRSVLILACALATAAGTAQAADSKLDKSLMKLDPSELVSQVCDLGAMKAFGRDTRYRKADRVMIDALSTPSVKGNKASGNGGALRADGKWFRFGYTCTLAPNHMSAVDFDYDVKGPIPEEKWSELGLWE